MAHCLFHCRPWLKSQVWWWAETLVSLLLARHLWKPEPRASSVPRKMQDLCPGQVWHWCEEGKAARAAKGLSDGVCFRCWIVDGVLPDACFVSLREESWDILDGFISIESLWIQVLFGFWMSIVTPGCLSQSLSLPQLHVSSSSSSCAWSWSLAGRCSLLGFDFYLLEWFWPEMNFPITIRG